MRFNMSNKKNFLTLAVFVLVMAGSLFSQESKKEDANSQNAKELDDFDKSLDSKIFSINKKLEQYSDLMEKTVTHTPSHSRFRKGNGYIEMEKYDFVYVSANSSEVVGGKKKITRLYYNGKSLAKVESEIIEENYKLRTKTLLKVTDPSPGSEDNGDISVFKQLNTEKPLEFKVSEMDNTISNPNRIGFKKEFYLDFITNLEEDLRYTRKYVDFYGTNSHQITTKELKKAVDY